MKMSITQTDWNYEHIAQKWTVCIKSVTKNTEEKSVAEISNF